jgi:hypothetical protein
VSRQCEQFYSSLEARRCPERATHRSPFGDCCDQHAERARLSILLLREKGMRAAGRSSNPEDEYLVGAVLPL